jgi:transglutaminase-like putative cysteine protease
VVWPTCTAACARWRWLDIGYAMIAADLSSLPRDTRDTWFLLLVMAWVLLPLVEPLPLWASALTALVMIWRATLAWRGQTLPSRWWRLGLLALAVAATLISYKTLFGRDAGVTLVVMLLALKTLELRARRDAFVVFFLSFFLLLTNFFYSQSLLTAVSMLLALLGLLTALVNAHMPLGRPPLLQSARVAGSMMLLGAPIMLLLFLLFPRLSPLWGMPGDAMTGRSGLSGQMTVGSIASLALDDSVAMRVRFDGEPPPQDTLYFRGPVLSHFDGSRWRHADMLAMLGPERASLQVDGPAIRYEVTLEPSQQPWLLVLDAAVEPPRLAQGQARMTSELQWLHPRGVTELLRYQVTSYPQFSHGPRQADPLLGPYLALPDGYNPRTQALANALLQQAPAGLGAGAHLVEQALARLRSGGYVYTLEPGVYGRDSADEFWFERKAGFCEHIASSFVLLMRAAGVPARIVTGYQGGALNPVDNFWTVRQSDAHAWAEVWLSGQGWVRVDPTGAVAPARTGSFTRLTATRGILASALLGNVSPQLMATLRATWEAMNNGWNQWVLNYTQSSQLNLLKHLGIQAPDWEDLIYLLCAMVVGASMAGAVWAAWQQQRQDPWLRLLARARQRLSTNGAHLPAHSTPRQLIAVLNQLVAMPASERQAFGDWLLRLETLRYASQPTQAVGYRQQLATLRRDFQRFR